MAQASLGLVSSLTCMHRVSIHELIVCACEGEIIWMWSDLKVSSEDAGRGVFVPVVNQLGEQYATRLREKKSLDCIIYGADIELFLPP